MTHGMNKKFIYSLVASVLVIAGYLVFQGLEKPQEEKYLSERTVRYGFSIENKSSDFVELAKLEVFVPVEKTPFQRRKTLDISVPYSLTKDSFGNEKAILELRHIPPYGSQNVTITSKVAMTSEANELDQWESDERFLRAEAYLESDHEQIIALSKSLLKQDESAKNLHDWAAENIKHQGYVANNMGALYAVQQRKGDCTEYSHAFVALSRSADLPSIPIAGFELGRQNAVLHASDYHNWAYVYERDRWVISDPMENVFDTGADRYVAFNLLNEEANFNNSQRFYTADERLSIRML